MAIYSNNVSIANDGELIGGGIDWQSVKTSSFTAVAGEGYFVNTTSAAITVTLPASPSAGDTIGIIDYAGTFATNNVTLDRNGNNIKGSAANETLSKNNGAYTYVYIDGTQGWKTSTTTDDSPEFISATGGTVTTSGNFKIHTFTGDGCFVVSSVGNPAGSDSVSYLVIAGGGGGGGGTPPGSDYEGGGGGAGGFREGKVSTDSYTASPLDAGSGLPVSATTYPVTVGGGGGGSGSSCTRGGNGSNSVFSTITSTGGGGGGSRAGVVQVANNGGSGGGGGQADNPSPPCSGGYPIVSNIGQTGGTGNSPPVSPSQGNPGGGSTAQGSPSSSGGGGGGGAGSAGGDATYPASVGGNGGSGASSSITGSPVTRAGGGGGAGTNSSGGLPTSGPGGQGAAPGRAASNGTANTGGGGGGSGGIRPESGGAGGKGIVIIRYKFQ
jgi:hypothetical protein